MLDYEQDVGLLHAALLSYSKSKSENVSKISEEEFISSLVETVYVIKKLSISGTSVEEKEYWEKLHYTYERLNAALFFTCLKSNSITCAAANNFYGSIKQWPELSFASYIDISHRLLWSEYFIEYMQQLPNEIVLKVIKLIKESSFSSDFKIYSWHLILQVIFHKVLLASPKKTSKLHFIFEFSSKVEDASANVNSEELLLEEYSYIFKSLENEIESSPKIESINLILYSLKSLLKIYVEGDYKNKDLFKRFDEIVSCLRSIFVGDECREILKSSVNTFGKESYHPIHSPWGVKEDDLIFDLCAYWNEIQIKDKLSQDFVFADIIDESLFHFLKSIHPLMGSLSPQPPHQISYLQKVIQFNCPKAFLAIQIIIEDPNILQTNEFLTSLEDNFCMLEPFRVYKNFINSIPRLEENKNRALQLFLSVLDQGPKEAYDLACDYILKTYGITDKFCLSDFDDQLVQFVRKTYTLSKAEKILPTLLLQSPEIVLDCVIEQVLIQGKSGECLIQVLKLFPKLCSFKINGVPLMVEVVAKYFRNEKLDVLGAKNAIFLIKFVITVASEVEIFSFDDFVEHCFFPNLFLTCSQVALSLECLNVSLNILMSTKKQFISQRCLIDLVLNLGKLINECVKIGRGRVKELAVTSMSVLEEYQNETKLINDEDKILLYATYSTFNELVCAYALEFLPSDKVFASENFVWIYCCKTKSIELMFENLKKEPFILPPLTSLLLHLTKEEWMESFTLFTELESRDFGINLDAIPNFLPPHYKEETKVYSALKYFILNLHIVFCKECDTSYVSDCFSSIVMNLISQDAFNMVVLSLVFLELCFLLSKTPEVINHLTPILLEINRRVLLNDKTLHKLLLNGVTLIPESMDKQALYSKLTTAV